MRRARAAFLVAFLASAGCAGFEFPLGGPEASAVAPEALGRWLQLSPEEGEEPLRLLVVPFNEREYYVEVIGTSLLEPKLDTTRLRVYTVPVDGVPFANAQLIGLGSEPEPEGSYTFWRYELTPDSVLVLRMIDDELSDRFSHPDSLRRHIAEHLDDEDLYAEGYLHFVREPPEP